MSTEDQKQREFERRAREALLRSTDAVEARVRSRLNQARQAAVESAVKPRRGLRAGFLPALGAAAATLLVALVIGFQNPHPITQVATERPTVDDLDLLADGDGLDLMQSDDGSFYEWAVSQTDGSPAPAGSGSGV